MTGTWLGKLDADHVVRCVLYIRYRVMASSHGSSGWGSHSLSFLNLKPNLLLYIIIILLIIIILIINPSSGFLTFQQCI